MNESIIENLNKVNQRIDLACDRIQKQNELLKWIDDRCLEGITAFNRHELNVGQAVTILQDIHASIFEYGVNK